jgi:outer membrane lipoprotein carrier protein
MQTSTPYPAAVAGLTALALAALPAPSATQDAAAALERAEAAYRKLTTLTASFTQTLDNPMLGTETAAGVLYLERPNRFAMRFTDPAGDRIVVDGTWLWLYAPSSVPEQVIRQPVPSSGMTTPNLMGQFADRPLERYEARYVRADTVGGSRVDVVALVPRQQGLGFRSAEISIDDDGLFRRIRLVEDSGQRRTLMLDDLRTGAQIPEQELRFTPPDGVRIVVP